MESDDRRGTVWGADMGNAVTGWTGGTAEIGGLVPVRSMPAGGESALIRSAMPKREQLRLRRTGWVGSVSGWKVRPASKTDCRNMGLVTKIAKK